MSNLRLPLLKTPSSEGIGARATADISGRRPEKMRVGDLAERSGKTVRAIHLYEELDLLKPAGRSKGRYRLYGPEALVRIRWIGKLQDLGFSLSDIKTIVKDFESEDTAPTAMIKVRDVYKQKLDETRAQIERLRGLEREMLASLAYLDTCDTVCEPDRLHTACECCDHHSAEQEVPDLVAGFRARRSSRGLRPLEQE